MKFRFIALLIIAVFIFGGKTTLFAQDEAAQKAMTEYMTPGKMHEFLSKLSGEWKSTIKLWMAPNTDPVVSQGTAKYEMILGGRYLQSKHSSTVMGMPMEGFGIDAYDNGKKVFLSTWYDNMGTGIMMLKGTYNEAAKTMTYEGTSYEPVSGKDVKVRELLKFIKDGYMVMEMFMNDGTGEFKSMEIEMTRTK